MNNNTNISETAIIITTVIVVVIIIIFLYLAYYFYGGPYESYIIIAMVITLFVVAAIIAYFFTYSFPSTMPIMTITPAPGSTPPVTGAVKFGDIIALDNLNLRVGTILCNTGNVGGFPVVSTPMLGNKAWVIQGGTIGTPVSYGGAVLLQNTLAGFPANQIQSFQAGASLYRLYVETSQTTQISFTINKGTGNSSTSSTVMYSDIVTLTSILGGSPYMMAVNSSDSVGPPCGSPIDMLPQTNPFTPSATFTIN